MSDKLDGIDSLLDAVVGASNENAALGSSYLGRARRVSAALHAGQRAGRVQLHCMHDAISIARPLAGEQSAFLRNDDSIPTIDDVFA